MVHQPSQLAADDDGQDGKFPMKVRFRHVTVKVHRKNDARANVRPVKAGPDQLTVPAIEIPARTESSFGTG
jgi:hypothetical protein